MMEQVPLPCSATVLELGSGDGYQLELLRRRFARVYALDLGHRPARAQDFVFASAERLPFPDQTFDLVTSNCVLEHVGDRRRAIEETFRVLRSGGYVAHVVPTQFWKATSVLLNPGGYPLLVWEKAWALRSRRRAGEFVAENLKPAARPGLLQVLGRWTSPQIHGVYASHLAEYRAYARSRWAELLSHPQMRLIADVPTLCYTQFGFGRFHGLQLRQWLAKHGFASSRAFILRKVE
jgi:ubiquinone/menaquinone biosynthesis C-methylase UbiE